MPSVSVIKIQAANLHTKSYFACQTIYSHFFKIAYLPFFPSIKTLTGGFNVITLKNFFSIEVGCDFSHSQSIKLFSFE